MGRKIFALTLLSFLTGVFVVHAIGQYANEESLTKKTPYISKNRQMEHSQKENGVTASISIGDTAPKIKAGDINGKVIDLSDYKGKKVILNFWATWCPPCQSELPALEKYYKMHHSEVVMIGINIESREVDVQNFIKKFNITYPIIMDRTEMISDQYQIQPIPTTYFIDENGNIYNTKIGPLTFDDLKKLINKS